jgi:uncharacterized membrane protein
MYSILNIFSGIFLSYILVPMPQNLPSFNFENDEHVKCETWIIFFNVSYIIKRLRYIQYQILCYQLSDINYILSNAILYQTNGDWAFLIKNPGTLFGMFPICKIVSPAIESPYSVKWNCFMLGYNILGWYLQSFVRSVCHIISFRLAGVASHQIQKLGHQSKYLSRKKLWYGDITCWTGWSSNLNFSSFS